ncbi:MAG: hypothetical protein ACLFWB_04840, partial [Armatimonadota bacterium]
MAEKKSASEFHRPEGRPTYSPRMFSACRDSMDRYWAAWHATEGPLETIRVMSPEECPDTEQISDYGLNFEPAMAAAPDGVWCVWSQRRDERWRLVARYRCEDWGDVIEMPTEEDFVFHAAAVCDDEGRLWVAYVAWDHGQDPSVAVRTYNGEWSEPITFDRSAKPQMRPALAAGKDGQVWIAFCSYFKKSFRVVTARLAAGEAPEQITTVQADSRHQQDLSPDICVDAEGVPWLAWITYVDVTREGVIGRQTDLNVAQWDGTQWSLCPGAEDYCVTHLDWGMLPVETYWGYNGLRHRPQLNRRGDGMWVFWERHRTEQSVAGNVGNGQFCGAFNDGRGWGESKLINDGHACHLVKGLIEQPANEIAFACKLSPRHSDEIIDIAFLHRPDDELEALEEYDRDLWEGWEPVELPEDMTGQLQDITVESGDDEFELLWGDLHCHTYYSPDAEGEPLELLLYGRDRGGLDFCCTIDNDYYPHIVMSRSALDYNYAVAQAFEDADYQAFWGYEYTYHLPREGGKPKNHRAVVYYDRDQPIARRTDPDGRSAEDFLRTMEGSASLWHPHHEEWELWGYVQEENVEAAAEWFDYMQKSNVSQDHLKEGYRFGLTGASDNHRICPGMGGAVTGLYVRDRSREGVIEALKRRRCYCTTGCRVFMDFRINGHFMGSEFESYEAPIVTLQAQSTDGRVIEWVKIWRDEQLAAEFAPGAEETELQ